MNAFFQENKKDLFSLDYFGNFSLSSSFNLFTQGKQNKKQRNTLHSIFGICQIKK